MPEDPKYQVIWDPNFVFSSVMDNKQLSVCEVAGMIHVAYGESAVGVPKEIFAQMCTEFHKYMIISNSAMSEQAKNDLKRVTANDLPLELAKFKAGQENKPPTGVAHKPDK